MMTPYMSLYKATKAFVDFFSKAINQEYSNIDILSHQPLLVSTPMTQYTTEHGSISAEKCALGGLQRLGLDDGTPGHW
jgi:short-subunit dehydrogenase